MEISQVASHAVTGFQRAFDQAAKATTDIANMASEESTLASQEANLNVRAGLGVEALNMANETIGNVVDMLV